MAALCLGVVLSASVALAGAVGAPERPKILGISHAAFYVTDMAKARAFYEGFLGYAEPYAMPRPQGGDLVGLKINDRQSIELFPGSEVAPHADRLYHVALEVSDAEAMRVYLASKGVSVPARTAVGKIGNKNFFIHDPNGNTLEIVEYLPEGKTLKAGGQFLPPTRVSTLMRHVGVMVGQYEKSIRFYEDILGCTETWRGSAVGSKYLSWVNMKLPDSTQYIEMMLYADAPSEERMHTMHHVCLEVPDVAAASALLRSRSLPEGCQPPTPMKNGVNGKRQVNYYDPDGTRIEIMEPTTASGKPVPPSTLPPPVPTTRTASS